MCIKGYSVVRKETGNYVYICLILFHYDIYIYIKKIHAVVHTKIYRENLTIKLQKLPIVSFVLRAAQYIIIHGHR